MRPPRVRELVSLAGDADRPSFSPDGRRLAFIGTDVDDPADHVPPSLWVMDLPTGAPRDLTAALDRPVGDWAWSDLLMADEAPGPAWLSNEALAVIALTGAATSRTGSARRHGCSTPRPGSRLPLAPDVAAIGSRFGGAGGRPARSGPSRPASSAR